MRVEGKDMIAAIERSKEAVLQTRDIRCLKEVGAAACLPPRPLDRIPAAVDHVDAAVASPGIGGRYIREPALEGMVESRDLVPGAEVALQFEVAYRLQALRHAGAASQERKGDEEDQPQHQRTKGMMAVKPASSDQIWPVTRAAAG